MSLAVREPSTPLASGGKGAFLDSSVRLSNLIQELTMADVAFVVVTIAVFAVVALVAKGVTRL
ncbi:hypothetical protein [Streptomyces adelaidensis]|uniref:hypothetical protein n=1 Tax=Streptomyces adelaidensis TaxID=2796465 RepID=UPI00190704B8|nr:hypothetical protein [Streptomyces adelaidensis]